MNKLVSIVLLGQMICMVYANYGYHHKSYHHSIPLAIQSYSDLKTVHVPSYGKSKPTYVDIPGSTAPIYMDFKTKSSPLIARQSHVGAHGTVQKSYSHDSPHKLVHIVTKPVVQELRETIVPYRKIVKIIEPVSEKVETVVHKGHHDYHYKPEYKHKEYNGKYNQYKSNDDSEHYGYY